jgi:methyl-accepting chemotaxis protein
MLDYAQTDRIIEILKGTEADLTEQIRDQKKVGRRAVATRIFFALIGLLALVNLYFVNQLTMEIRGIITNLNEMYGYFATTAVHMSDIRSDMTLMEQEILLMPVLREQMESLAVAIERMNRDVGEMTESLVEMDQRVGAINAGVSDMALRFRGLNRNVGQMGLDVDQMARPVP